MLVSAAAEAQKERAEHLKVNTDHAYKQDSTWTQGLISAAKAIASGTSTLIETANDVVEGKVAEEAVIAASKGVSASTAQLIAATRSKAEDLNSSSQQRLNLASRAITLATSHLVEVARGAIKAGEEARDIIGNQNMSDFNRKIQEMELQTQILKMEKDLDSIRQKLFDIRKLEYTPHH